MGSFAWRILGTGSAVLAAAVATKAVSAGWRVMSGRPAPDDPTHPDESGWQEALLFAALTGLAANVARVAATRRAAQYYARSSGHLPKPMIEE